MSRHSKLAKGRSKSATSVATSLGAQLVIAPARRGRTSYSLGSPCVAAVAPGSREPARLLITLGEGLSGTVATLILHFPVLGAGASGLVTVIRALASPNQSEQNLAEKS